MAVRHDYGETPSTMNGGLTINIDSEKRFMGIIGGATRMYAMLTKGIISPEDYRECLRVNAVTLGISEEELRQQVEEQAEPVVQNEKAIELNNDGQNPEIPESL